jgi:hypothetical protein
LFCKLVGVVENAAERGVERGGFFGGEDIVVFVRSS